MKKLLQTSVAAALLGISLNSYSTGEVQTCSAQNPQNCLNGVGPAVTNPDAARVSASQVVKQTSRQSSDNEKLATLGKSARSGLSAGDGFSGLGVWGSLGVADFSADIPIPSAVQPLASYEADSKSLFIGVDKLFMNSLLLGVSLGFENTDIDTAYNGGNNETDGYTIAPYAAYLINNHFSVDVAAGYTTLSTDTDRIDNVAGGTIVGEFDADRWFTSANLNANMEYGKFLFGGRIGLLYSDEDQDGYSETGLNTTRTLGKRHIDLTQGSIGFDVAYRTSQFEPYATFTYINDIGRDNGNDAGGLPGSFGATQPEDDDEIQAGLGVRWFGDQYSGSLEWTRTVGRDTFDADSFVFSLRADF